MDAADTLRWFDALFQGAWTEAPGHAPVPQEVADDSRAWAARLLADHANPYADARLLEQRMLLGRGASPDKLVTLAQAPGGERVSIVETLQHFAVGLPLPPGGRAAPLDALRAGLLPLLAPEARRVVEHERAAPRSPDAEPDGPAPVLLSAPRMPISAISRWSDRVALFRRSGAAWADFPKAYAGRAVPVFRQGLDWYPAALRETLGVAR